MYDGIVWLWWEKLGDGSYIGMVVMGLGIWDVVSCWIWRIGI